MKQNSQWLSHVRTRSNTALCTSTPSGSPSPFETSTIKLDPAPHDIELELGLVGEQLPLDDVAGNLAVEARDLVAGREPGQRGGRTGRDGDDEGCWHGRSRLSARPHR